MKHLIETENPSGLTRVDYDRIILNSDTDDIIVRRGGYVDLGLPSGLKWAKCNVGAKKETDCGYYFQWGDIVDKTNSDCGWGSYKYGDDAKALKKYNNSSSYGTVDNKTTLDPEDDAARFHMGGDWRMPTRAEFQELLDNTVSEWIEDFNGSGVNGRKFTGSNGKYIFIPAAGYRSVSSFSNQGRFGYIWSSSLNTAYPSCAWRMFFDSDGINAGTNFDYRVYRYYGYSVRGVL